MDRQNFKFSLSIIGMALILMLTLGIMISFGVFLVDFKTYFQTGSAVIGAVSSLSLSVQCFSAPFTSIVGQRVGCRIAICCGCLLTSVGLFLSSIVQKPWHLLVSHSLITGLGCSLAFINLIPLLGIFSENQIALVNGIVFSGNGVGVILFPMICEQLGKHFGFRGALKIVSALSLDAFVLALLMKFANEELEKKLQLKKYSNCTEEDVCQKDCHSMNTKSKFSFISLIKGQLILCYKFPRFTGLLIANVLLSIGYVGFLIHMVANATYRGLSESESVLIASMYGIGSVIGRLTHGIPIRYNWISAYHLFWLSCFIDSIAMISYSYCSSKLLLFIITAIISYNVGIHIPLLPVMLRLFVGDEYFHQGFGILQVPGGLGCLIGGFTAGWIYDQTNSYHDAFLFMGISYLMVPLVFLAIEVSMRRRRQATEMYNAVNVIRLSENTYV